MALAALARVVFGAYDSYPTLTGENDSRKEGIIILKKNCDLGKKGENFCIIRTDINSISG